MQNVREIIEQGVALCREQGVEPNRVRMGSAAYKQFHLESLLEMGEGNIPDPREQLVFFGTAHDLAIVVQDDCPADAIYVDRKPEDE